MPSDNLKPTTTEDRLSRYIGQLSQVLSQDYRNYITQNFDTKKVDLFLEKSMARFMNLAAFGGTFLTGLPRLTRFSYFLYIMNIPSILSKKWDFLYYSIIMGKPRSQKGAEDTPWPEYRIN
jgi:hypothetical protein